MSSSFEKINYNIRPNKFVERKMICEALSRLVFIDHLSNFRYIGFGSAYFVDFSLFHKQLGIKDLISIEKEESKQKRFEFNIPYSGIKMKYGNSTTILPNIDLGKTKNIIWLDYDDKLTDYMFSDIDTVVFNSKPGSFIIISINVEQDHMSSDQYSGDKNISLQEYRFDNLVQRIGRERIPSEFLDLNMTTKNLILVTNEMINRQIKKSLINRNGTAINKFEFKQILNFEYKDNATIMTLGGIIIDKQQSALMKKMDFGNLSFVRTDKERYVIQCPNLTIREVKELDKLLPDPLELENGKFKNKSIQKLPLNPSDIKNYAKVYRYYPNFADANL